MGELKSNVLEMSVSELSFALKKTVEEQYGYVRVRGELGRISRPASGHVYLDIKDDKAVLNGVIWRGVSSRLKHQPEEGLEVIASGKLTTFPGSSKYQIVIDAIEPAGAGALMQLLEERKKKLAAEGLFDEERKQLLPYLPRVIGVVTSPSGSVIRDILHRLKDRFALQVIVWPVRVQGEECGNEVAQAIVGFNSPDLHKDIPKPDLIIVARGGGSVEDLWSFNDEAVVRAAANSVIPLISAVGHETDWTLLDMAADIRAPTPSAAAEIAVPVRAELDAKIAALIARLHRGISRNLESGRNALKTADRGLSSPQNLLNIPRQNFDTLSMRLTQALAMAVTTKRSNYEKGAARLNWRGLTRNITTGFQEVTQFIQRRNRAMDSLLERIGAKVSQTERLLASLSYKNVLDRGFAVISGESGNTVTCVGELSKAARFKVLMQDGEIDAVPARSARKKEAQNKNSRPGKGNKNPIDQGDLF